MQVLNAAWHFILRRILLEFTSLYSLLFQNASSADTLSSRGKTEDYETKVVSNPVM
jgi:hypothetical protein